MPSLIQESHFALVGLVELAIDLGFEIELAAPAAVGIQVEHLHLDL